MKLRLVILISIALSAVTLTGCLNSGDKAAVYTSAHAVDALSGVIYHYKGSRLAAKIDYNSGVFSAGCSFKVNSDETAVTGNVIESMVFDCSPQTSYSVTVSYYPSAETLASMTGSDALKVFRDGVNIPSTQSSGILAFSASGNARYNIVKVKAFQIMNTVLVDFKTISLVFSNDIDPGSIGAAGIAFDPAMTVSGTSVNGGRELLINLQSSLDSETDYRILFLQLKDADNQLTAYSVDPFLLDIAEITKVPENWTIQLSGVNKTSGRTSAAYAGVSDEANADDDAVGELDQELPPLPPFGSYFQVYFVHSDGTKYFERDTKKSGFSEVTWTFYQEFSQFSGETYYIWWEFDRVPSGYSITLVDVEGSVEGIVGKEYDMKEKSGYDYTVTDNNEKKKFQMRVKKL